MVAMVAREVGLILGGIGRKMGKKRLK